MCIPPTVYKLKYVLLLFFNFNLVILTQISVLPSLNMFTHSLYSRCLQIAYRFGNTGEDVENWKKHI